MRYWYVVLHGDRKISWRVQKTEGDFDIVGVMKNDPNMIITFFKEITEAQAEAIVKEKGGLSETI